MVNGYQSLWWILHCRRRNSRRWCHGDPPNLQNNFFWEALVFKIKNDNKRLKTKKPFKRNEKEKVYSKKKQYSLKSISWNQYSTMNLHCFSNSAKYSSRFWVFRCKYLNLEKCSRQVWEKNRSFYVPASVMPKASRDD